MAWGGYMVPCATLRPETLQGLGHTRLEPWIPTLGPCPKLQNEGHYSRGALRPAAFVALWWLGNAAMV
jgi:hypothetical protein